MAPERERRRVGVKPRGPTVYRLQHPYMHPGAKARPRPEVYGPALLVGPTLPTRVLRLPTPGGRAGKAREGLPGPMACPPVAAVYPEL
jgi:hypothetical protein